MAGCVGGESPDQTSTAGADLGSQAVQGMTLRFGTKTERDVDITANGENTTSAVNSMNRFAVDLYQAVSAVEDSNLIIGPYSVVFALSMIHAGANGTTAEEMADVLRIDLQDADWQEGINAYDLSLDARTAGSQTNWTAANKVWTEPGLPLRDEYLDVLTGVFDSPLAEANFAGDPEREREIINRWAEANTLDLVPELFPAGSIDQGTAMVLVNAVALDAPWEFPFDPAATSIQPFTKPDGTTVDVPMMRYDEFLPSAWSEQYQAVELPYSGGVLSMVVIVPTDLAEFEEGLSAEGLMDVLDQIDDGGIHLSMPKFSTETHLSLKETLTEMGMPTAFDSAGADFSGMIDGRGLYLSTVEHGAFVEVDENGTRAAAATGGSMEGSHGPTVDVNRPFLYLIVDRGAGTILFIGRVSDPSIRP